MGHTVREGDSGDVKPVRVDFNKPDPSKVPHGLEFLLKWEQVHMSYSGASRAGLSDPSNIDGNINVYAGSFGANYWFTRHLRLSLNWVTNYFPNSARSTPTMPGSSVWGPNQRAQAPANQLAVGVNDGARDSSHILNELACARKWRSSHGQCGGEEMRIERSEP